MVTPVARRRVSKLAREVTTLDRLTGGRMVLLWSGEPVTFRGEHVLVDDVTFLPTAAQRPRVPGPPPQV
jgi:alkanesulfonate monooxygenase SsuD/methylene tetrahydromethanopterin reductase-like flavin-dependent oxidoreductase (luciferase family)